MYKPKAIKGQRYPGYIKLSISQVEKLFRDGQHFDGFLVGNKVAKFHFHEGWHLASDIKKESWEDFKDSINAFLCNLEPELGTGAAIYRKIPKVEYKMRRLGEPIPRNLVVNKFGELVTRDGTSIEETIKAYIKEWKKETPYEVSVVSTDWLSEIEHDALMHRSRGA